MRACGQCGHEKPLSDFQGHRGRYCAACRVDRRKATTARYRESNRPVLRERYGLYYFQNLKARYGLSRDQYEALLQRQGRACAICGEAFSDTEPPHVDHDHACCTERKRSCGRCVRALLCRNCNLGIGYFQDDPARLKAAALYLKEHNK